MKLSKCKFCGSNNIEYFSGWVKWQDRKKGGREPTICCLECDISVSVGYFGFGVDDKEVEKIMVDHWNREPEDYPKEYETKTTR